MSRKHFSWLLFVTFVVAMLVLMLPSKTGQESGFEKTVLLPGLEQQVNDLSWIRFTGPGSDVIATLERKDDRWIVAEASGYLADWEKLKSLLSDMALAEVIEPKTANPAYYDRLGVEDIDAADATGLLVEFADSSSLPAVIIGKSAQGREGQYARLQGQSQSALINRTLDLPRERVDWLDREIIDISDAEVVEYEVTHPDGGRVMAGKVSADDENFSLQDIPEGREVVSEWAVNAPANTLASLNLEEVVAEEQIDWTDPVQFRLLTADGLQIEADLVARTLADADEAADQQHWIRLRAGIYTTAVDKAVEVEEADQEALQRASKINDRVQGWAYRIPKYRYESMSKRMADMLKSEES